MARSNVSPKRVNHGRPLTNMPESERTSIDKNNLTEQIHSPSPSTDSPLLDEEEPLIQTITRQSREVHSPRRNRFSRYFRQGGRERMLRATCIVLSLALFGAFLAFYLGDGKHSEKHDSNRCETISCISAASNMLQSMNTKAEPCDDFYQYACGGWEKEHRIPEEKTRIGTFEKLSTANNDFILSMLEEKSNFSFMKNISEEDKYLYESISAIFESCTNVKIIDNLGVKPMRYAFDEIEKMLPADVNLTKVLPLTLLKILSLGAEPFFSVAVSSDNKDPSKQVLTLYPSGLGLPSKEYYQNEELLEIYKKTLENIYNYTLAKENSQNFTIEEPKPDRIASSIVEFEKILAGAFPSSEEASNVTKTYNVFTLATLQEKYSKFDWLEYFTVLFKFNGVKFDEKYLNNIVVTWPGYFENLNKILKSGLQNDAIGYYLRYVAIKSAIPFASQAANDLLSDLRKAVYGLKALPQRSRLCLAKVDQMMGFATGRLFTVHKFSNDSKNEATKLIKTILSEFKNKLVSVDWLEPEVLKNALAKVDKMTLKIGFPDIFDNPKNLVKYYDGMNPRKNDFFGNYLQSTTMELRRMLLKLESPTDRSEWVMYPHMVNAYYEPSKNEIVFPAGILQAPFYHIDLPNYINYGALGVVVGHELSHAFDATGREFNADGKMVDWWTFETAKKFNDRKNCFIDQYNKFSLLAPNGTQIYINGVLTVGENMADNSGILQSWMALKKSSSERVMTIPGTKNFTTDQIFFLSFAQIWCGKSRPEYALQLINTDPHSPNNVRVSATLQNTQEFREAFNCGTGSKMAPPNMCALW